MKIKDGEIYKFKRFETKDIKVIKDVTREKKAEEEKEFQKELKELENLEKNCILEKIKKQSKKKMYTLINLQE